MPYIEASKASVPEKGKLRLRQLPGGLEGEVGQHYVLLGLFWNDAKYPLAVFPVAQVWWGYVQHADVDLQLDKDDEAGGEA
jgi:hypothetical protein